MTGAEKQDIFTLLQKTSSWALGYCDTSWKMPAAFEDDVVLQSEVPASEPQTNERSFTENKPESELPNVRSPEKSTNERLLALKGKISVCQNCVLSRERHNAVPGEGMEIPLVMVIGEGPGEEEDKTGRPFVGPAGQLLDKMLGAIQLSRTTNCYIANIVKCRPPHNRTPMPDEASACSGYLQAQIHILKPKMILAMGRTAAQNLLNTEQGINALRGKFFDLNGIPLMATYHPSALLHDESLKRPAWEDLKTFKLKLKEIAPEYDKLS